ncbi:uncharacterized protein LOC111618453 [Centruroides sculpturatus]|uniref:uncharacterized protein LOC111618453 n=1 Tax=Centruroides sculpturatus TaxID=218467 RepID=UPI000C6D800A|nr:uncharacterized protein LOC111618453 [Centruroides sculpturatus]
MLFTSLFVVISFVSTLKIVYAVKTDEEYNKDRKTYELDLNKYCKVSLNSRNHLRILCNLYYYTETFFDLLLATKHAIIIRLAFEMESTEEVEQFYNTSENIPLWYTNLTVEKFSILQSEKYNYESVKLPLLNILNLIFEDMKRVKINLIFNEKKLNEMAQVIYSCNDTFSNFQNLLYEIENTTCKFIVKTNFYNVFSDDWIEEFQITEDNMIYFINEIKKKYYLDRATITEMLVYFKEVVVSKTVFSLIAKFNVIKLEFPENDIQLIRNGDVPFIPKLKVLNMTGGITNYIEKDAFDNVSDLKLVDLSKNKLNTIPEPFYKPRFVNLTYLNLEENKPDSKKFSLPTRIPESLPSNLKILRLSRNLIMELENGSFAAFSHLHSLFLDRCNLTSIPKGTFNNLIFLLSLDLADNYLESLPDDVFVNLHSLQHLNLSNNRFMNIPVQSISMALNLTFINFQNNFIKGVYNFSHPSLQYLNLKNNQIKELIIPIEFSQLHILDLSSNRISLFSKEIIDILLNIDFVNLSSNPFYCSPCNLYYLHTWLNGTNYRDSDHFICSLPTELTDKKVKDLNSRYEDCLDFITDMTITITLSIMFSLCFVSILSSILYYYRWYLRYFWFRFKNIFYNCRREEKALQYYEYDAFVVYCVTESKWVYEQLVPHLESEEFGLKLCVHDRDFLAGRNVTQNIIDSIDKSRKIVVLISNCFMKSEWCMLEIHLAQHRLFENKRDDLILVKMEKLNKDLIKKPIVYLLKTRICLEWPSMEGSQIFFWRRLKTVIKMNMLIIVWILTITLHSNYAWDIESDTCDELSIIDLVPLFDCNFTLNDRNYLQVSCGMFTYVEKKTSKTSFVRSAVELTFGLESDQPLNHTMRRVCLRLANLTINKFPESPNKKVNYNTKFSLFDVMENVLNDIKEIRIFINFIQRRIISVGDIIGKCNPKFTNLQSVKSLMYTFKRNNCYLLIYGIIKMLFSDDWFPKRQASNDEIFDIIDKESKILLLDKAEITDVFMRFNNRMNVAQLFKFGSKLNVINLALIESNIQSIENNTIAFTMPKLELLNMTGSKINFIDVDALDNLPALRVADFSKCKLQTIPKPFYKSRFVNLTYLNLEENVPIDGNFILSSMPSYSSNLKILILSKISITHLSEESFDAFIHLQFLYLDRCKLSSLPDRIFANLTSLIFLDLSGNYLENLSDDLFFSLQSLRYLNLSRNRLQYIPERTINLANNLITLNLEDNIINSLSNFSHSNLKYLNLRKNRINNVIGDINSLNFSSLHSLDLSSNTLSYISKEMIDNFLNIEFVNLSSNPFNCSPCNLYYLQMWLKAIDYRDSDLFICSIPAEQYRKKVISINSKYEDCLDSNVNVITNIVISIICVLCIMTLIVFFIYYHRWYIRYLLFRVRSAIWNYKQQREASCQYKYDAFVSYSDAETKWVANELVPKMESEESGLKLCMHQRDFVAGKDIVQNITEKIEESRKVVILLSNNFLKSDWCMMELYLAHDKLFDENRDALILVKIEELKKILIPRRLQYYLKTRTYLLWPTEENARLLFWNRLTDAIKKHSNENKKNNMLIITLLLVVTICPTNSWDVTNDTCEDVKIHKLIFMPDCKLSMNSQKLQASCDMYCYIESFSPYVGLKRYAIEMTIGMESDNFIYSFDERICLRLANLTIRKFRLSPHQKNNYGLRFTLMSPLSSTLASIIKGKAHINFNKRSMVGIAATRDKCNVTSPNFDFMAIDEHRNASCKLTILGIYEMLVTVPRIKKFPQSKQEIIMVYKQFDQIYFLHEATISEFSLYLTQDINSVKMFSIVPNVNFLKLELPENHFDIIRNDDFSFTPTMEVLNMTRSTIYLIEENAFDNLPGLRIVDFSRNRLQSIPEPFYKSQFVNLTYLNLEANKPLNKMFSLPARSDSAQSNLKILILSKTSITHLERGSFASFSHLRYLYLSECHLASIPEGTFLNLTSLVSLDLSRNRLEMIADDIFVDLYSLQYLNLSSNRFYFVPQSSINFVSNLTFLNLESNAVKYLSNFSHFNLRYLNVRNNRIKEFTNESIDLPLLKNLDISSNLISNFSKEFLEILQIIKFVNLSSNPFNCSPCNLYYLHVWLNATDYRDSDNFICFLPEKVSNEKVINLPSRYEDCLRLVTDETITIVISSCSTIFVILLIASMIYYYRWSIRYLLFHLRSKIWYFKQEKLACRQYKYDAFISFCDEETEWVANELVPKLESEESGLKLCIRLRDFILGEEIHQNIIDKIEESRKVVILLSDNFLKDNWRMTELYLAHDKLFEENRDALILVKMEELQKVLIPRKLRYLLKTRTYLLRATEEDAQLLFWSRLKEAITKYNNPNKMKELV